MSLILQNFVICYIQTIKISVLGSDIYKPSISFYNNTIRNSHYADFTTKYPVEKIFLLALFYHLLTIYFGVGDYCLSNSPTSCLFSSQSSSLCWLRSANTDKNNYS